MKRAAIAVGVLAAALALLVLATGRGNRDRQVEPEIPVATEIPVSHEAPPSWDHRGFLYGRVTTDDGATYEGRLRWGGDEEAFWGDYFNGFKDENPWAGHVQPEQLEERRPIEVLGVKIASRESQIELGRPFSGRFGDIERIEARGPDIRVVLKSGTVHDLDRRSADDLADGVRVWDAGHGVVDLEERQISVIEFLPTADLRAAPERLHGTARTRQGDFTGFIQWDRRECVGTDELDGQTADGEVSLRFDTIRSIARSSRDSSLVTLFDGREIVLSGSGEVGHGNRGLYVDDSRYGRVLISWDAFERVDFSSGRSGPAFDEFSPGRPLAGSVTTREGRRLIGRLVYDLDEGETTETLDAPFRGVNYTIPFGLIASIAPAGTEKGGSRRSTVILQGGEEGQLESAGDLGEGNAGMLVFVDGSKRPEYVPWSDVERVDFDRAQPMHPPPGEG
jgi:hypothetical protein